MTTISRVLTASTLSVLAASSLFFLGRYALAETFINAGPNGQPGIVSFNNLRIVTPTPQSLGASSLPKARPAAVKMKTHVLLVSNAPLEKVQIDYKLHIPMHHVRPDTEETLSNGALIDQSTVDRLLQIAHSGPGNLDFSPEAEDYPEYEDEFDCLSDMFRGGEPLPPELSSSVVNGLSLAYNLNVATDRRSVVFSPVTLMRADFPAAEIPNTAAHEAKYTHHVTVSVPVGGALLMDAGPVKATRTETTPSRHLVVFVQPQIIKPEHQDTLAKSADHAPTPG